MNYLTSAIEWKTLADSLKDILTECFFVFEPTTISMNNVDPEKVVEVYYKITPNPETYLCTTTFHFPVYIQTIYRVLRGVKSGDTMEMRANDDASLSLYITSSAGVPKNEITIQPLQETIPSYIRNPRNYAVSVSILNDQLYTILHDLAALSRQVSIHVEDQVITFSAIDEGGTKSTYSQSFSELDPSYFFHNTYLTKFLEKFSKPGIQSIANLYLDSTLPLTVAYYLENGSLEMSIAGLE
jgi:hypothetical protein